MGCSADLTIRAQEAAIPLGQILDNPGGTCGNSGQASWDMKVHMM